MDNVEWRQFPNHPMYEVNNIGEVRRKDTHRIRKPIRIKNGYMTIMLTDNGKHELEYIHRAVAKAFIENTNNYPQVNHLDKNRENNSVENLEWCTATRNVQHSKGKRIAQYDANGNYICSFVGSREAERQMGVSHGNIDKAANKKYKTAYGYIWRYENE